MKRITLKLVVILCELLVDEEPPQVEELFAVESDQLFFPVELRSGRPLGHMRTNLKL